MSENILKEKWFHSKNEDGDVHWQGQVLGVVNDNSYLVQLYSYFTGTPTIMKIIHISEMIMDWDFYDNADEMRHNYREKDL